MKRATRLMIAGILVVLLLPGVAGAQPAPLTVPAEQPATGFFFQGGLTTGATWITGLGAGIAVMGVQGTVRVGAMLDALAITGEISYSSVSDDTSYRGTLLLGPSADIFLWRSADQAIRMYLLAGVNFGVSMQRDDPDPPAPAFSDDTFASQLVLGVGGMFFVHRNFPIGVEVGSRTTFIGVDNPEYVSGFFAGLTFGLVAGD